mmetsp:Transcript_26957/g.43574  ORF Transcript_26957/g.43574 Transcript_26957/m.43574 type:complete len:549 (+) Transcript_26957:145-1791(+)
MYGSFSREGGGRGPAEGAYYDTVDEMVWESDSNPASASGNIGLERRQNGRFGNDDSSEAQRWRRRSDTDNLPIDLTGLVLCASAVITVMVVTAFVFDTTGRGGSLSAPAQNRTHHGQEHIPKHPPSIHLPSDFLDAAAPRLPPPNKRGVFVRPSHPEVQLNGRHLLNGSELVADWSGTRIYLEFSESEHVWVDMLPANLSRSYSQNERYWCPHYAELFKRMNPPNSPSQCPYWYDVWEAYVDGDHTATIYLNYTQSEIRNKAKLSIRGIATGLERKLRHRLMLYKRTGPKKGGTVVRGIILDTGAKIHRQSTHNYIPGRRIEVLGASEEDGECALGKPSDFYATNLESSLVSYGTILGNYFGADVNYVCMGSEGIVLAGKPESAPYIDYYRRTLYGVRDVALDWNSSRFKADVVLVANGITDWGNVKDYKSLLPRFAQAFAELLATIRSQYPLAWIVLVPWKEQQIEGMHAGLDLYQNRLRSQADDTDADDRVILQVLDQSKWPQSYRGCENHPGPLGHKDYAKQIAPTIESLLGWQPTLLDSYMFNR